MAVSTRVLGLLCLVSLVVAVGACAPANEPTPTSTPTSQPTPRATAQPTGAATPQAAANKPKYGGVLVAANRGDPPSWDPMRTGTATTHWPAAQINGRGNLVRNARNDVFSVAPNLAKSWVTSDDFRVWTFTLRDDVVWHDGTAFTADDVKFWLDLMVGNVEGRKAGLGGTDVGLDSKFEVLDPHTIRVTKSRPAPSFLYQLLATAGYNIAQPKHLMEPEIKKGNVNVAPNDIGWVGLGPFKMQDYAKGSVIRVRRFDRYWEFDEAKNRLPYLDGIDFPIMTDEQTVQAALRSGRIDVTTRGNSVSVESQKAHTAQLGNQVYFTKTPSYGYGMAYNVRRSPWNDIRVRQAVSLWIDRQESVQTVLGGEGVVSGLMGGPTSPYTLPDLLERPGYNPSTKKADRQRAKELLAEAGYPNGFETTFMCRNTWLPWCEFSVAQLSGLLGAANVHNNVLDTATHDERIVRGEFEIIVGTFGQVFPDGNGPDINTKNARADVQHDDTHVDELFLRLAGTGDPQERISISHEIERYVLFDQALTVMYHFETAVQGWRSYVKGYPVPAMDERQNMDLVTVWLDK